MPSISKPKFVIIKTKSSCRYTKLKRKCFFVKFISSVNTECRP